MALEHFDDPGIPDGERLFRRIHVAHVIEAEDGTSGISSAAFRDLEMSVNLEGVMVAAGREPRDALRNNPDDLLVSLQAGSCRKHRQQVGPDPTPDEPAHGYVYGVKNKQIQRALRDAAVWVVPVEPPPFTDTRSARPAGE